MSIKSQKSLYEECSEIVERSYSVRTPSEDSLSWEEEDEGLALEVLRRLTPAALSRLRRCFRRAAAGDRARAADLDRRVEEVMRQAAAEEGIEFARKEVRPEDPLWLSEEGFVSALDDIFGHHKYTTHAHKLFQLLDPFATGKVRWRQVLDKMVAVGARRTRSRAEVWTPIRDVGIRRLEHCKRETLVKLVSIEKPESFCYVAVSRGGRVGVYSGQMQLVYSYEVFFHRTGMHRRVKNCWITDAIYLTDVQCLILSASDRSLTVYDAATLAHIPVYCITGLPTIPTCMAYSPGKAAAGATSELVLGSERGDLTRLRFLQPRVSLFYTNFFPAVVDFQELSSPPHTSYCSIIRWRRVHSRSVRRLCYTRGGDVVVSCSHDCSVSVRARHVPAKLQDYVFKVQRGVSCFHVVPSLHLVATGSCDGIVRLWESTQATPFASLPSPSPGLHAVLDVVVVAAKEIVIAYCSNCHLHIWDMYEECLLQTVKIKFPVLGVLGKKVEFGAYCIHPGPTRKAATEDDQLPDPLTPLVVSRRGSSVYRGSTGGLMLLEEDAERPSKNLEDDPEYIRFNRSELVVTCCDYVCTLVLSEEFESQPLLPPPGDTLRARRPSFWDLPDDVFQPRQPPPPSPPAAAAQFLSPAAAAEAPPQDLDTLLQNAGLQGILEKDFVLMKNLKHDLNRKLAEMEANKTAMMGAVSMGAPYLAIRTCEPTPLEPVDDMADEYRRVMKLFPGASVVASPTASETSTPRKRSSQL